MLFRVSSCGICGSELETFRDVGKQEGPEAIGSSETKFLSLELIAQEEWLGEGNKIKAILQF